MNDKYETIKRRILNKDPVNVTHIDSNTAQFLLRKQIMDLDRAQGPNRKCDENFMRQSGIDLNDLLDEISKRDSNLELSDLDLVEIPQSVSFDRVSKRSSFSEDIGSLDNRSQPFQVRQENGYKYRAYKWRK
ncbi:Hypothetical_protein [Hexamita inflata]|uniref:Hypothetical_protein n=1 Tax=Hexamita inflata TaxID=28002 RepID=A0AA86NUU0_9EUKA|nr:Hypothetical protein HINF_LOCUS14008 [Hexamita inflata]